MSKSDQIKSINGVYAFLNSCIATMEREKEENNLDYNQETFLRVLKEIVNYAAKDKSYGTILGRMNGHELAEYLEYLGTFINKMIRVPHEGGISRATTSSEMIKRRNYFKTAGNSHFDLMMNEDAATFAISNELQSLYDQLKETQQDKKIADLFFGKILRNIFPQGVPMFVTTGVIISPNEKQRKAESMGHLIGGSIFLSALAGTVVIPEVVAFISSNANAMVSVVDAKFVIGTVTLINYCERNYPGELLDVLKGGGIGAMNAMLGTGFQSNGITQKFFEVLLYYIVKANVDL